MKNLIPFLLIVFGACSTLPETPVVSLNEVDAPDWVRKGQGAFVDTQGKIFYGVGSASGDGDWSFKRLTADNRARNDLAKVIDFYTASLFKDYQSDSGNLSEKAMKLITNRNIMGAMIVDHYEIPQRGEIFSLAKLDIEKVKDTLNSYLTLSSEVKDKIEKRANRLHQELLDLEKKRNSKIGFTNVDAWLSSVSIPYTCFETLPEYSEICYAR